MHVEKKYKNIDEIIYDSRCVGCQRDISFITKYDYAAVILKSLFNCCDVTPRYIDISDVMTDGYEKEYIISLNEDYDLFCERFYRNNKYLRPDDGIECVLPDCSDECMEHVAKGEYDCSLFINVSLDRENDEACKNACESDSVDGCDHHRLFDNDGSIIGIGLIKYTMDC